MTSSSRHHQTNNEKLSPEAIKQLTAILSDNDVEVSDMNLDMEAKGGPLGLKFKTHIGTILFVGFILLAGSIGLNVITVPRLFTDTENAIIAINVKLTDIQKDLKSLELKMAELQSKYVTREEMRQRITETAELLVSAAFQRHAEVYHKGQ